MRKNPWVNPKTREAILLGIYRAARERYERNEARRRRMARRKAEILRQLRM